MCSLMDDVIGWTAFLVTGTCRPWTGFTVQVNTALKRPIRVHSVLLIVAKITKVDRRKVSVQVTLFDPNNSSDDDVDDIAVHATGEGLAIINRGVLPEEEIST
jgi:acyl-CoA thioesterase FadM